MTLEMSQRSRVIQLYKNLLHMGKDYPLGYAHFREKLKQSFLKNKNVKSPEKIEMLIGKGEYIIKELESLYMLRKYRALKKRYYENEPKL